MRMLKHYREISAGFVPYCERCGRSFGIVYDTAEEAEHCDEECHHCSGKAEVYHPQIKRNRELQANRLFRLIDEEGDFVLAGRRYGYKSARSSGVTVAVTYALGRCGWHIMKQYDKDGKRITHWMRDGEERITRTIFTSSMRRIFTDEEKRTVYEMRQSGKTFRQIAAAMGMCLSSAIALYHRYIEEVANE
jgi:hypothetical protein